MASRRAMLRLALSGTVTSLLAACARPTTPAPAPRTVLPAPKPTAAPTPAPAVANADGVILSTTPDVPDAYLKLPPRFTSVAAMPGKGSKVTAAFISYNAPVPPRDQNPYWQELEKRLGITYEPSMIPADTYKEKMAALIASTDLPDLTGVEQLNAPDLLKAIVQGAFTDLTPYLEGDALKQFPNLAQIPEYGWRNVRVKQKIYGVPSVRFIPDRALYFRGDWADKIGGPRPTNADEFAAWIERFTREDLNGDGKADAYGIGGFTGLWYGFPFFTMMFRVPHQWRKNPDGTLTHAVETPEYRQTIEYMKQLYDAGVFHPDAASLTIQQAKDSFLAGKFAGYADGWTGVSSARENFRRLDPNNSAAVILVPPGFDGGPPAVERSQGFFGMTCIPAKIGKDAERVKELLRIVDYAMAPFGSEEYYFLSWGIPGVHHDVQNGAPVINDRGRTEIGSLSSGIGRRNDVFYFPTAPDDARLMQQWDIDQLVNSIESPVYGLYSPTAIARTSELNTLNTDRMVAIITGREPLSSFDTFVIDWRTRGGDQIRKEFEQELKSA
jgi:putative aldouronate transport system substrate-binding protein